MIWQMTCTHKLPKLCSATLKHRFLYADVWGFLAPLISSCRKANLALPGFSWRTVLGFMTECVPRRTSVVLGSLVNIRLNINLLGVLERRSYKQIKRETNNKHSRPNMGWGGVGKEGLSPPPPPKKKQKKQNDFQSVSTRTRTSVDSWLDQWLSGKLGTGSRV